MNTGASRRSRLPFALLTATISAAVAFGLYQWINPAPQLAGARPPAAPAATQVAQTAGGRQPMPRGNLRGWRQVFADSFNGRSLNLAKWHLYSGAVGGDPAAWWDPLHVGVRHGMLVLKGYRDPHDGGRFATGGLAMLPSLARTYGKYLVRFRIDKGIGMSHVVLLWPANNSWPPEIDLSEDNGGPHVFMRGALHYGPPNAQIWRNLSINETRWHTVGVEWTRGLLRFTVDHRVWWTAHSRRVPRQPMVLVLQTQTWPCTSGWGYCPNGKTPRVVHMDVDWVVAYARARRH
jgi:Glycosyl hydrolases family 16